MSKLRTMIYSLTQGIKNLRRNRMFSLASVGTMTACLFLFGIFFFLLMNIQKILVNAENTVGITVFFDDGISTEQIEEIGQEILKNEMVDRIEYLSAEEAWEKYKKETLTEELAKSFGTDNPLIDSASYTIFTTQVDFQEPVVGFLQSLRGIRRVNSAKELTDTLQSVNRVVSTLSLSIIAILLGVATFLIGTTISMGISVRKEEISIMKLIGAADYFIRAPYVVEGVFLGLIGSILPIVLLRLLYQKLTEVLLEKFTGAFSTISLVDTKEIFSLLIPIALLIGLTIGFMGSYFTSNRQLRKIK